MSDYSRQLAQHCENQIDTLRPLNGGPELIMDPHQQEAIELAAMALRTNEKAFSIIHSCGSGKTILEGNLAVASQRAKEELGMQNTQDIVLTTQRALLHTIYERLDGLGLDICMWGSGQVQLDRSLILANIQAIQNSIARGDLSKKINLKGVPLLIGDEADLFLTQARRRAVSQFPNAIKIGLTATDTWPDGRDVEELWGQKIHEMKLKEGILNGVNVPPLYYLFEANLDDSKLEYSYGDYDQKSLQAALKEAEIQKAIPEIYEALIPKNRRKDFPTLVYVPSVNLVHATVEELKEKFLGEDLNIGSWTGEGTTTIQIRQDMKAFNKGELDILVLCEMGSRGVDLPRARFLIDGYPTLSSTKLEQRSGRVLRRIREESELHKEGFKKAFAMIAQIIPQSNKYRPILLPDILDCWEDFKQGRLLGTKNSSEGGSNGGEVGSPIQAEVDEIRRYITQKNPKAYVRKVEEIDVLSQLLLREDLPKADEKGFFYVGDERYGTALALQSELNISTSTIIGYIKKSEVKLGINKQGRLSYFYSETLVRQRCRLLLEDFPIADENGFIEINGERYGTLSTWSREFDIAGGTIRNRLEGVANIDGKFTGGQVRKFYAEADVREICKDLLGVDYQANEEGFFELDGQMYGTIGAWSKKLGLVPSTIKKRITKGGFAGKNIAGRIFNFYPEKIVLEKCKDLIDVPYQVNEDGFFEINGERYGTTHAWGREMKVAYSTLFRRLIDIEGFKGRDSGGRIRIFYPEKIVKEQCVELLADIPQANEDGFFEINGERYGTAFAWSKKFGVTNQLIKRYLKDKGIKGKNMRGKICIFYSESEMRQKCINFMGELPQANKKGFFEIDGERYGNISAWGHELDISMPTIRRYLEVEDGIDGRDAGGRIFAFYPEATVRERCSALLVDVPKAGKDGFFEIDGERYGTIRAWRDKFNFGGTTLNKYLESENGIDGKDLRGKIHTFYPEAIVRERCSGLLDMPQAGKDGFFEIDGERYGTTKGWSIDLKITPDQVSKHLEEKDGILGRMTGGQIHTFYPESIVLKKCKFFLEETPQADMDGFIYIGGERYGLRSAWSKEFGILASRLKKYWIGVEGITGIDSGGHIRENGFYPESIVREKLAHLLNKK